MGQPDSSDTCDERLFTYLLMYKLSQTHLVTDKRAISFISRN